MAKIKVTETGIKDLVIVEPRVFGDERGYFMETYSKGEFAEQGLVMDFVQDNESSSKRGVLRGLHFQKKNPQGKLVRVIFGEVLDVAVDMRKSSGTFGKHYAVNLSGENKKMFYVPEGFAHGFVVLSQQAVFTYKCTRLYAPDDEGGIAWNDPKLSIDWKISENEVLLSDKDKLHKNFDEQDFYFE
ncbi:dTDP-4-dehydrorhamnose 3,5-epimerase [Clostridia bacterium]|nr:dTDP-4-dehydrorhamnose 3,5-epimerase [Clostridia bacterium]